MIALLAIIIIIIYLIIIGLLIYGFDKVEHFKLQDLPPKTKFSIVIPFRNESENLPKLLDSISKLNYSKALYEVILVDDDSEDDSVSIIKKNLDTKFSNKSFNQSDVIKIIKNNRTSNSPKKDAITSAIAISKFNWIITTDADCVLPKYWLDTFDECIQINQPNCIVAPITYHGETSFFNRFQTLDFLSLQGATIGGFGIKKPFMCNGANFAYRKSEFISVNGFEGNNTISSGDDIFILEKILSRDVNKVHYLNNWFAKFVGLVVLLGNLACLASILFVFINYLSLKIAIALFVIKFSIDFLLLFKTTRFFKQENLLLSYLFSSLIYPFFNVSIAFLSFFKSYQWKGRTSKK